MSITLVLARHGNTFAPGDRVVQVGSREDLPLVARGREQAAELAQRLTEHGFVPDTVLASPLRRAGEFAALTVAAAGWDVAVAIDERLVEIDYGAWGGLTREEIVERFGAPEVEAWERHATFPPAGRFGTSREQLLTAVRGFADATAEGAFGKHVLAVSSNGVMRFFLTLVEGELERRLAGDSAKTGTGRYGLLTHEAGAWHLTAWNA